MLAAGALILEVLISFLGNCSRGRAAQRAWLEFLCTLPTLGLRRRVLAHFLRTFEHAKKHGAQWRVVDDKGFVGRQHERVDPDAKIVASEHVDAESGEVIIVERSLGYPKDVGHRHCPGKSAGGLSAHDHRSPHTLNVWRRKLREGRIMGSSQPDCDASDAVLPKRQRRPDGTWAYSQHWLALPPTPEMLRRWRGNVVELRFALPDLGRKTNRPDDLWALQELVDAELSGPREYRA